MEQPVPSRRLYTVSEYLALEDAADERHEYRDGEILAMAGARSNHVQVVQNLARHVGNKLDGLGCTSFGEGQRIRVDRSRYSYADQGIVCGPKQFDPPDGDVVLTNPLILFEVLSESTEANDRGEKFRRYSRIESLREYVLVSQDAARIETFFRQADGIWGFGGWVEGLDAVWPCRMLNIRLSLADVYANVKLPPLVKPTETSVV